jgi:transcriptional regulator with XRE-family HTH domain
MPAHRLGIPNVGARIKELREHRGWSASELGKRSGITRGTIAKIEVGIQIDMKLSQALALTRALGITVEQLVGEVDIDLAEADEAAADLGAG